MILKFSSRGKRNLRNFSAIEIDPANHRFSMTNFPKQIERAAIAETGLDKLNWVRAMC